MNPPRNLVIRRAARRHTQGSFLLEALIAILIVALGVLGSVGLLSRSMQDIDEAKHRGEAAFLANALIGQMWVSDRTTAVMQTEFNSNPGTGAGYIEFNTLVQQRLPNANLCPPVVTVVAGPIAALATNSIVTIQIFWMAPGEVPAVVPACNGAPFPVPPFHQFSIQSTIGANT